MFNLFLIAAALFCAEKWLIKTIEVRALLKYFLTDRGVRPPTKEEIRACTRWATQRTFGIKR